MTMPALSLLPHIAILPSNAVGTSGNYETFSQDGIYDGLAGNVSVGCTDDNGSLSSYNNKRDETKIARQYNICSHQANECFSPWDDEKKRRATTTLP